MGFLFVEPWKCVRDSIILKVVMALPGSDDCLVWVKMSALQWISYNLLLCNHTIFFASYEINNCCTNLKCIFIWFGFVFYKTDFKNMTWFLFKSPRLMNWWMFRLKLTFTLSCCYLTTNPQCVNQVLGLCIYACVLYWSMCSLWLVHLIACLLKSMDWLKL